MFSSQQVPEIKLDDGSTPTIPEGNIRRSFESVLSIGTTTTTTTTTNHRFGFSMNSKSGSMNYSPLGNNSIFEVIMNTRNKNWLRSPTALDIPLVTLSRNEVADNWEDKLQNYVKDVKDEVAIFSSRVDLKRVEQMRQLNNAEEGNDSELIKQVPDFYFDKVFQLDNERTFKKVIDGFNLDLTLMAGDEDATRRERDDGFIDLKDKLNDYLDSVELLLVKEISKSSHKFFQALSEVDSIQSKISLTMEELDEFSKIIHTIDDETIQRKIENIKKLLKRKNVEKLEQGLLQVKLVLEKVEECKENYAQDKLDLCLQMIKSIDLLIRGDDSDDTLVQKWTKSWPYRLANLRTVPALVETREFLTNMKIEIGGNYSLQLSEILLDDLRNSYKNIDINEALDELQNGYSADKKKLIQNFDRELEDKITELIKKLNNCEELVSAFSFYQEKIVVALKAIIKKYLPHESIPVEVPASASTESISGKSSTPQPVSSGTKLSKLIREQTPAEFQEMLVNIFTHLSVALKRLNVHQKKLLDIALKEVSSKGDDEDTAENYHNMLTQLDIRVGINETMRIVQLRMGKIIAVRREITSTLSAEYFLKLFSIVVLFIQYCESLSGEFLTKYLSDVLTSQIKHYISSCDPKNIRLIQKKIELENWVPFIVSPFFQKRVNDIVICVDIDPISWTNMSELTAEKEEDESGVEKPAGNRKSIVVGDKTFVASDSLLTAIDIIRELLIMATNLPPLYLAYFEKLCYNVLKNFNNYAMSSICEPGTTNIMKTNKNLSVMTETMDCLAEIIGIVQRFFQRLANSTRDFEPYDPANYATLLKQYRSSSERIYQAHAPPPPV
ncbi:hypothetical protein KAFR_0E01210 [Kazachstania africana CBS 2517]|uniref:Uncharacterized protein n=1 Tax=Kazachstania africana (strain ATCC 22294 / BCRC 22015 / CBS 2517 / CECT 1963 / NBRC 1671 / NRRL Y-8276) TaxID=1071382 RepID=H2AV75_KAZAF|nr:hypothetical protein KAFR_0E01210 [Kazachstania africana CBS 2517]CCF58275.1 hypothetical protein KAFR_0E01210 [Kazachstania africana CBS 2517]